jgi:membrane protease YdiL (CAAX protease family)
LTPRLHALGLSSFANYLLTSVVWGGWHIPYWLFFLGPETINKYTDMGITNFIIIGVIALFPISIVFGELRLKTGTLWPAYIAHTMTNAISAQLVVNGFIRFKPLAQYFYAPGTDGLLMTVLFLSIGYLMMRRKNL